MSAATLFDEAQQERLHASLDARFRHFHGTHPHVYEHLAKLARDLVARGHRRISISMLFEVVRHEHLVRTDDPSSPFLLNNSYRSRYARLLMHQEHDLAGAFETRELRS